MQPRIFHVDAFTRTAGSGNPAGVVLDADGMNDEEMLRIAAELGYSETAFVLQLVRR
jgi:PhzF family phenazine biosynthesis protein